MDSSSLASVQRAGLYDRPLPLAVRVRRKVSHSRNAASRESAQEPMTGQFREPAAIMESGPHALVSRHVITP